MHDCLAFRFDLHSPDRIKWVGLLISFWFETSLLATITFVHVADPVKHVFGPVMLERDYVKHCPELPRPDQITLTRRCRARMP
jgi:hypothetical protein